MAQKNKDVNATGVDPVERAKIEALRGITRDENGQIVLSAKQKKERIAYLENKIEDFANRTKNAKEQIKALKA